LKVRHEFPRVDAGDLAADATQIFRFAAVRELTAEIDRFTAQIALHRHDSNLPWDGPSAEPNFIREMARPFNVCDTSLSRRSNGFRQTNTEF
jgi:hypothetical protein